MRHWITNYDELATTPLRADALSIIEAGLDAVDTHTVITRDLEWDASTKTLCVHGRDICFSDYEHIYFVGFGKCAVDAGLAIEEKLGDALTAGIVIDVRTAPFKKIVSYAGAHPLPEEANVVATDAVVDLLSRATERDLVLAAVSGGGSALLCAPHGMGHQLYADIAESLMQKGANIHELNTVRKHLSHVLGGNLAKIAHPATVVALVFSDVLGNDIGSIASGPFMKDTTTKEDAEHVLAKYDVMRMCTTPECEVLETPKEDHYFERVTHMLLVTNERALTAMHARATELGYSAEVLEAQIHGEARTVGETLARDALAPMTVRLYGGETTVTSRGGKGGRNLELSLAALPHLGEHELLLSFASDGKDNGPYAGGIADTVTQHAVHERALDVGAALSSHESENFWRDSGHAVVTGATGTNIADLLLHMRRE